MWKQFSLVLLLVCCSFFCMGNTGCDLNKAEEGLLTAKQIAAGAVLYTPKTHTYIPAGISALATAALTILKIIKERRETLKMKKAIKAKARQIGKVITAPTNPDSNKENPVLTFMRKDKSLADDEKFDALSTFDAVRKGYI